mmetsp:Transcript_74089/g.176472  ORF Transcript_74089/g.176472 Transcript_74089/m.176472 type:complete len:216 (+) Transcript_74089:1802-2449(+)
MDSTSSILGAWASALRTLPACLCSLASSCTSGSARAKSRVSKHKAMLKATGDSRDISRWRHKCLLMKTMKTTIAWHVNIPNSAQSVKAFTSPTSCIRNITAKMPKYAIRNHDPLSSFARLRTDDRLPMISGPLWIRGRAPYSCSSCADGSSSIGSSPVGEPRPPLGPTIYMTTWEMTLLLPQANDLEICLAEGGGSRRKYAIHYRRSASPTALRG